MSIPQEVMELENRSFGINGEPTLFRAYELLYTEWQHGSRDREVGLHLMFLAWYVLCEPSHLTGWNERAASPETLSACFHEIHEHFLPTINGDVEMLYVVGLMAHLFPYLLGEVSEIETLAGKYRQLYRLEAPLGLSAELFNDRGAYGDYFRHQVAVVGGY